MPSDSRKQAQKYVKELLKAGLRNSDIQHAAGIHYETVRRILEGTTKTDRVSGRVFTALKALHEKHVVRGEPLERVSDAEQEKESPMTPPDSARAAYEAAATWEAASSWKALTDAERARIEAEYEIYRREVSLAEARMLRNIAGIIDHT